MSSVRIRPGPVSGAIQAPSSKSYTHRALVVGHLAGRPFLVRRPLDSDDTRATAAAMTRLGTRVRRGLTSWQVVPRTSGALRGGVTIPCHESGTTLRFVSALAALADAPVILTGSGRLSDRPIDELLRALTTLGARCRHLVGRGLPLEIRGPIRAGRVSLDASQSSQFASALLLALPTLEGDSQVDLRGELVSKPYLDATLALLRYHGIRVGRRGRRISIPGGQRFRGSEFTVPGDASSAAYLWGAAAVAGGTIRVDGVPERWPQADLAMLDLLRVSGAAVSRRANGATVRWGSPRPFRVNLTDAPDLYPLAGVRAATIPGVSYLQGAAHVALKESDRRSATAMLARRLGAKVTTMPAGLRIAGTDHPRALDLPDLADHRVVMSAAVGALAADRESIVGDRDAVRKSFPDFWNSLGSISGRVVGS